VQFLNANKCKLKDHLVGNPIETDWNLNCITKDFAFDKKVGKILTDTKLNDFYIKGQLGIESKLEIIK